MQHKFFPTIIIVLIIVAIAAMSFAGDRETNGKVPNMVGTYKLIMRELPDGTKQTAPDVMGLLTLTEKYRNFNIVWQDDNGKRFSYSIVSQYELTPIQYTETIIFSIMNDEIGGKQINYDLIGETRTVPIGVYGSKVKIDLPFDPISIIFEENWITAKTEDQITDYWERVP